MPVAVPISPRSRPLKSRCDPFSSKLPTEVISIIFTYAMKGQCIRIPCSNFQAASPTRDPQRHEVVAPLNLGAVCRRWRDIAWAMPHLWRMIIVNLAHEPLNDTHVALFKACVARSKNHTLCVGLFFRCPKKDYLASIANAVENVHARAMITAFLSSSSRVVRLALQLPEQLLQLVQWNSSDPQRPLLQHLDLRCMPKDLESDMSSEALTLGAVWDGLTSIGLRGMHFEHTGISWKNLTNVNAQLFSAHECLQLLQHAEQLTTLSAKMNDELPVEDFDPDATVLVHKRLQRFTLDSRVLVDEIWIFDFIALPALEVLNLTLHDAYFDSLEDILPEGFRSSLTSLKRLAVIEDGKTHAECPELIRLFKDLPTLEFLHLSLEERDQAYYTCLFESLASRDTSEVCALLPKLKELRLNFGKAVVEKRGLSWELVPAMLAPFNSDNGIISDSEGRLLRRPLRKLQLLFGIWTERYDLLQSYHIESSDVVRRLISLMDAGVELCVGALIVHNRGHRFHDVLESSIRFHGLSRTPASVHARNSNE